MKKEDPVYHKASFTHAHRILHWLIAATFLFIIITIWLRMGLMSKEHVAHLAAVTLAHSGVHISSEEAINIGRAVRQPLWNLHIFAGYFLIGLYLMRLLIMRLEGPVFHNPFSKEISGYKRFKSIIYLIFYICLGLSLVTGFYIEVIGRGTHVELYEILKGIHKKSLYYAVAYIFLHLAGLVYAELTSEKGIVSRMIHGQKN